MNLTLGRKCCTTVMACGMLVGASMLEASQLWSVDLASQSTVRVIPVNPETGATGTAVIFGSGLAARRFEDLASDPERYPSLVWGLRNGASSELLAFDPIQQIVVSRKTLSPTTLIYGLAIDPTDGAMYGALKAGLCRIARDTGEVTLIGGVSSYFSALAFDAAGNLYSTINGTTLVLIDKATGATTNVGTLNVSGLADMAARPEDGVMFALGAPTYSLFRIDLSTAASTAIGPSTERGSGMAFTGAPSLPGDFDGDGVVDAEDLSPWYDALGTTGTATRNQGDADGDFDVDGEDFLVWQWLRGRELPTQAESVPEPGGAWLALTWLWILPRRRARTGDTIAGFLGG